MKDRYQLLRDRFKFLPENAWLDFKEMVVWVKKSKDEFILKPTQTATGYYYIHYGACRSFFIKDGLEITDYFFFENAFASDYLSLFSNQPSKLYIQTIEDSELFYIDRQKLLALGYRHPIVEQFNRVHAERAFVEIAERLDLLHHEPLEKKFTYMLQKFPALFQRVPQYQIASYLGVKPESLSRIKRKITSSPKTS